MKQTQTKTLPFSSGWHWVIQAGNIIGEHLAGFLNLAIIWMFIGWIEIIPLVGTFLLALITPALVAGAMSAFHSSLNDRTPRGMELLSVLLSDRRGQILQVGLVVILLTTLCLFLISFVMMATTPEWQSIVKALTSQDIDSASTALTDLLAGANLMPTLITTIIVFAVLSASLFFAIPRLIFDQQELANALKESLTIAIRNWRALIMFILAQVVVILAGAIMLSIFLLPLSLLPVTLQTLMVGIIFGLFFAFFQVLVTGGQYLAWREIFPPQEQIDDTDLKPPDQFIA